MLVLGDKTKKKLAEKRLIFVTSTGRCGTKLLAAALRKTIDGRLLRAEWETHPNFAWVVRASRRKGGVAKKWWLKQKLPAILSVKAPVYLDTSHYLTQGALGAAFALGVPFDLVLLSRDPRETAVSFWRRQSIPLTKRDKLWPTDSGNFLPIDHGGLDDYQLVYWWVMEVRYRMWLYGEMNRNRGQRVVATSLDEIATWGGFVRLCRALSLPEPDLEGFPAGKVNPSSCGMYEMHPEGDLDELEAEVWRRVASHPRSRYTRPM